MLIDADRYWLILIDADWCWLMLIVVDWYWIRLTRFSHVGAYLRRFSSQFLSCKMYLFKLKNVNIRLNCAFHKQRGQDLADHLRFSNVRLSLRPRPASDQVHTNNSRAALFSTGSLLGARPCHRVLNIYLEGTSLSPAGQAESIFHKSSFHFALETASLHRVGRFWGRGRGWFTQLYDDR